MHSNAQGPTRRQFAGSLVAAVGGLAFTSAIEGQQQPQPTDSGDARTALHQEVELAASAARIENALLDAKQFAAFSGLAATIDPREGGAFSMFGGVIVGRMIEIVSGQRIVQAWRPTHWDPGVYSMAKFVFRPSGSGTRVVLDHTGFPAGDYDSLSSGWYSHYWEPLKKFFV